MTDTKKYSDIPTLAKDIVKDLNSYLAKQLKKHNINLIEDSSFNDLLIEELGKEIIDPDPEDISDLTIIIEDYIRRH